jgi:tRNA-2-methylthio-N6-dimethylallyladenosine synthase
MGCQMNERDSETIAGLLSEMGYVPAAGRRDAAVVVVNTCSVRDNADKRFFGVLGQLKKLKEEKPEVIVAVCGCMMQRQSVVDAVKKKYGWVDIVFGVHNLHRFPELLKNAALEKAKSVEVWGEGGEIAEGLPARRKYLFKAYISVMYGCDNFCTYCVVPYTRGRERSRRPVEIMDEARELARSGVKEITLLGQNVNSYAGREPRGCGSGEAAERTDDGRDCREWRKVDFSELIYRLNGIDGIERIRFMTSHPKDLSDRLMAAYRDCGKLCGAIHLPVQSGSDRVLARMNRKYTREEYFALVGKLRDILPDIAITTDIMTGFPGETEEDFAATMDLVERVRFDSAFTFLYSVREGTPAAGYADQVPEDVKHTRFNRLTDRLNAISAEKNGAYKGRVEKVLAEGPSKTCAGVMAGRTGSGKVVNFPGSEEMGGEMADILITETRTFSLYGEIVKRQR